MGIIQRESVGSLLLEFLGLLIGFISILFIYPLSDEGFGYAQFLLSTSILLIPFMGLGVSNTLIKFFPKARELRDKKENMLVFAFILSLVIGAIFLITIEIFSPYLRTLLISLDFNATLISDNKYTLIIITFLLVNINSLIAYISNFGKIAAPSLIKELGIKLFLPFIIFIYYLNYISLLSIATSIIIFYCGVLLLLILYSLKRGIFNFSFRRPFAEYFKFEGLFPYMIFTSLTSISGIMAFRIDLIMIAPLLSLEQNGVYAKIIVIAAVLEIPVRIFSKTVAPSISKYWHSGEKSEIQKLYKSTTNNSFLLSILFFILLIFNLNEIFSLSSNPESFVMGVQIFSVLAISKLIGVISGIGNSIIAYSPSYRVNLIFLIVLALLNIILNYLFIIRFGVIGAAYATVISTTVFHFLKGLLLFFKYRLYPFSVNLFKSICIALLISFILIWVPSVGNAILDIGIKSSIIILLFVPMIVYLKISSDINNLLVTYVPILKKYV